MAKVSEIVQKLVKNAELYDQRISNSKTSRVKIMNYAKFVMYVTESIICYIYNILLSNIFTFLPVTSQYFVPNYVKKLNKSLINSQSFDFFHFKLIFQSRANLRDITQQNLYREKYT